MFKKISFAIFTIFLAVFAAHVAVDMAFIAKGKKLQIAKYDGFKDIKSSVDLNLMKQAFKTIASINKPTKILNNPVVKKQAIKVVKQPRKIAKRVQAVNANDIKDLSFEPKITTKVAINEQEDVEVIEFLTIEKENKEVVTQVSEYKLNNKTEVEGLEIESIELELSYNKIEEQKLVKVEKVNLIALNTIAIDPFKYGAVKNLKVAKTKTNKKAERISKQVVAQVTKANETSSDDIVKSKQSAISHSKENASDELVLYDYSKSDEEKVNVISKKTVDVKESALKQFEQMASSYESPEQKIVQTKGISNDVVSTSLAAKLGVSNDLLDLAKIKKDLKKSKRKIAKVDPPTLDTQRSKQEENKNRNKEPNNFVDDKDDEVKVNTYSCLDEKLLKRRTYKSQTRISLRSIDYSKRDYVNIHNFDLNFQDDENEHVQDYGDGHIDLNYNLTTSMNIRRAVAHSRSHYPVALDLVFEGQEVNINIPAFKVDSFNSIVDELGITGQGAALLVELDEKTEDVDLDFNTKYEAKVYLNERLKVVDRAESNYMYVLYLGTTVGNTIISFKMIDGSTTSKIIHLASDQVYYEPNFYAEITEDQFHLYSESLLTQCKSMLDITSNQFDIWSFDGTLKKLGINGYQLNRMVYPVGTRKYTELKHLDEGIFVGRWSEEHVIIPSEKYIRHALEQFDIYGSECLVQLNLSKNIKSSYISSNSKENMMRLEEKYLDKDGSFYDEVSPDTKRIFLKGSEQGLINIKLDYTDGSSQFLQTYCSDNTYLVEQL